MKIRSLIAAALLLGGASVSAGCRAAGNQPGPAVPASPVVAAPEDQCDPPWIEVELRFLGASSSYEPRSGTMTLIGHDNAGKPVTTRNKKTGVIEPIAQTVIYRDQTAVTVCIEIGLAPNLVALAVSFSISNTRTGDWITLEAINDRDQEHVLLVAPRDSWDAPTGGGAFHASVIVAAEW